MTSTATQHRLTDKQIEDALFSILKDEDQVLTAQRVNQVVNAYNDMFKLYPFAEQFPFIDQLKLAIEIHGVRIVSIFTVDNSYAMANALLQEIEYLNLVDWAMDTIENNRT